jgi:hypothetical protein
MTTNTRTYWENDNGAIYCQEHLGGYMRAATEANPTARTHHTPLGTFYRLTKDDLAEITHALTELNMGPECCETCRG